LTAIGIALLYGTAGFWFLDKKEFGPDYPLTKAFVTAAKEFVWIHNTRPIVNSRYARVFLDSYKLLNISVIAYSLVSLFRPVVFEFKGGNRERAKEILDKYGGTSNDFFKLWKDKSYVFNGEAFVANLNI
jgi:phosphatidylglycerol lysyltransferase